jgi:hypothetical protein
MSPSRLHRLLTEPVPVHRGTAHVFFAAMVWPVLTIAASAYAIKSTPYHGVSWREAFMAAGMGTLLRLPDLIIVGAIFFGLSGYIFKRLGSQSKDGRLDKLRLGLEPVVIFLAAIVGVAIWYPAVLSHPLLMPIDFLPAWGVLTLLAVLVLLGALLTGRAGRKLRLAGVLFAVGLMLPVPLWTRAAIERAFGDPPTAILLGVDSISQSDDLSPFAEWAKSGGGTWYEHAVTPALFTNAVWTSILSQKPIRDHGIFHTFLRMKAADASLLHAARAQGYRTVGMFSDQLTAAPGLTAGFDESRSGPVGWRQLLLPIVANGSVLVPFIGSALPRPWPGGAASNESGTFTYDLGREIRGLLRAGRDGERTFVAAHLTYVHLPSYPRIFDLTSDERWTVLKAQARRVRDRTFDWQDRDLPDDPLPLGVWKIRRVQSIIRREFIDSGYLQQGGRLVLFSDHGSRLSLDPDTFGDNRYHHVLLATFGLPARCPSQPISLIDIGRLLEMSDVQSPPVVEIAMPSKDQWPVLFKTSHFRWSGEVDLDPGLLSEIFKGLRSHEPWSRAQACK